jgi:hypothetical protein
MAKKEKTIELKAKAEKVTDKELKQLQNIVSNISSLQNEIGKLESQKHIRLHKLAVVRDEATLFQNKLEETYGTAEVNIQDGSITYKDAK